MKKHLLFLLIGFGFSISLFSQTNPPVQKFTLYGSFGLQYYKGDLGNGIYKTTKNCNYAVASLGLDYKLNKSLDLKFFLTRSSLGYLQPERSQDEVIESSHEHGSHEHHDHGETHEHGENPYEENLSSRLSAGVVALQYNLANGSILPEDSKFIPQVYMGMGINYLSDPMGMDCVKTGVYATLNTGASLNYKITSAIHMGIKMDFGVFTSDNIDFINHGGNDFHMQNSFALGYSF